MSKVLWHITMSLDGFVAGPGDGSAVRSGGGQATLGQAEQPVHQVVQQPSDILDHPFAPRKTAA